MTFLNLPTLSKMTKLFNSIKQCFSSFWPLIFYIYFLTRCAWSACMTIRVKNVIFSILSNCAGKIDRVTVNFSCRNPKSNKTVWVIKNSENTNQDKTFARIVNKSSVNPISLNDYNFPHLPTKLNWNKNSNPQDISTIS